MAAKTEGNETAPLAYWVASRLDPLLSRSAWRGIAAFLAGLVGYLCVNDRLFLYLPALQIGLFVGALCGLIAAKREHAVLAGVAAAAVGLVLQLPLCVRVPNNYQWGAAVNVAIILVTAAVAAVLVVQLRESFGATTDRFVFWAMIALLGANLLVTSQAMVRAPFLNYPNMSQALDAPVPAGQAVGDGDFYRHVVALMRTGKPYYDAFGTAYRENTSFIPLGSVLFVRPPTLFWFWASLPGPSAGVLTAMVLLGCATVVAAPFVTRGVVPMPVGLIGSAGLASYYLFFAGSNAVYFTEQWGGAIAVLAAACFARSVKSKRWKAWLVACIALCVLAVMMRELMLVLLVAGIASAFLTPAEKRRFALIAWSVAVLVVAVAAAAHFTEASHLVVKGAASSSARRWFANGGPGSVKSAVEWGDYFTGTRGIEPWVLAVLGVIGAFLAQRRDLRAFEAIAIVAPLFGFLFVGSDFVGGVASAALRVHINYWGAIVMPLAIAVAPAAFALLPLRRPLAPARPQPSAARANRSAPAPSRKKGRAPQRIVRLVGRLPGPATPPYASGGTGA